MGDEELDVYTPDICCACGTSGGGDVIEKQCARCHSIKYCSKKCQKKHFPYHAQYCYAIVDSSKMEVNKLYKNYSVREEQVDAQSRNKFVNLIGEKPMIKCYLDGANCEALWDAGSMVSKRGSIQ